MVKYFTLNNYLLKASCCEKLAIAFIIIFCLSEKLCAQQNDPTSLRKHQFELKSDTVLTELHTISPSSVVVKKSGGNALLYGVDFKLNNNKLELFASETVDSISIQYRILQFDVFNSTPAIDSSLIALEDRVIHITSGNQNDGYAGRRIIQSSKLEYSGSFSRGIAFGNTQDVVLNSSFNLQMSGDLGNGLMVRAAISDENIPIQPEGNTQVLQEFDKIFIEIQKDKTSVIAGDYEIASPEGYYMKYYKKLKGLSIRNESDINEKWTVSNKGSFAVSRGKFKRQTLSISDGNQGPYKLEGENGEIFLQVLSGTEKVFADGILLVRGETNDYVIDYNRGEIRFTPNRIIRANVRIIVEFEYAVQSYLRSLFATSSSIESKKLSFNFNLYHEQDSKTLSSNIEFDSIDIKALQESGDMPVLRDGRFIPEAGIEGIIRYKDNNGILTYSPADSIGVIAANFTNLGMGNGQYIIDNNAAANGRVYKYVGSNGGAYDPVIRLIPPEKKQLFTLSGKYNISDSTSIFIETGLSNNDRNRFSAIGNEDNQGFSIYTELTDKRKIGQQKKWLLSSQFNMESSAAEFRALNPYRDAEFVRDWSIDNTPEIKQQQLFNAKVGLSRGPNAISYRLSGFQNRTLYSGLKQNAQYDHRGQLWNINIQGDWLDAESSEAAISFIRPKLRIGKYIFNSSWLTGIYYEKEKNLRKSIVTDSLSALSFNYDLYRIFAETSSNEKLKLKLAYVQRQDDAVVEHQLAPVTISHDIELGGMWNISDRSIINWQLVFREYQLEDKADINRYTANKSFIGNIDHKLNLIKDGMILESYFEANSGQEPKFEFQYLRVQNGEGSYTWNDYNMDTIQQINEFVISPFSDQANFEKITVFNNEFISTNRNVLNQSIRFDPRKFIENKKSFIARTMVTARYRIEQKSFSGEDDRLIRFINFDFQDSSLVAYNAGADINLFFNRGNPDYDLQCTYRALDNKINQISGYEQRSVEEYSLRGRVNINNKFDLILEGGTGKRRGDSEMFNTQDFEIDFWNIGPKLNFRPKSNLRIIVKYNYQDNRNRIGGLETGINHNLGTEFTWRQARNSNLQLRFDYVDIQFSGEKNSALEFEMLQGLKNGQNALWQINYTRRIANNIDLIVNYQGRKSADIKMVNTAGVQMRAIF